ncbi:MAG: zinc ribbon domain-containing protein [Candidatus Hydrothermales bacterium]
MKKEINIDEIKNLEAKRKEFQEKLLKLKEKEKETKPHIFRKVFSEYQEKLRKVEEELEKRKDILKEYLEDLYNKRKEIEKEKIKIEDEIEEIKLRYSIGEYDDTTYKKIMDSKNVELKRIKEKFNQIDKEINELRFLTEKAEPKKVTEKEYETLEELKEEKFEELTEVVEIGEKGRETKAKSSAEIEEELIEIEGLLEEVTEVGEEKSLEEVSFNEKLLEDLGKESKAVERGEVICKKCGHKNSPDSWFCENCGAELIIELE